MSTPRMHPWTCSAPRRVDDATWPRGRGWALLLGLGAVRGYRVTNPALAAVGARAAAEVPADHARRPDPRP